MNRSVSVALLAFVLFVLTLPLAPAAQAWWPLGHRLVARLAEADLTDQARAEIQRLLRNEPEPSLAGIAHWADTLRDTDPQLGKQTAPWHYVNLGEHDCQYDALRDCPEGRCVIAAIQAQSARLADPHLSDAERLQALKFVVHLVGDVHQPLHAGYARDKGGNTFQIHYQGKGSNLHQIWDNDLLQQRGLDEEAYFQALRALPAPDSSMPSHPADWASQSCAIVLSPGFYPAQARLDTDYSTRYRPLAEQQLRQAGIHLAELLNTALTSH